MRLLSLGMSNLLTLQHDIIYKVPSQGLCDEKKVTQSLIIFKCVYDSVLGQIHSYPGTHVAHGPWAGCALMSCLVILQK